MGRKVSAAAARAQRAEGRAAGSEGTIARLKEQYEYWLAKKDRDAAKFIAQLNVYRAKKRTQLETADLELVALWDAVDRHARVLRRVKAGKYPLHQLGSNVSILPGGVGVMLVRDRSWPRADCESPSRRWLAVCLRRRRRAR